MNDLRDSLDEALAPDDGSIPFMDTDQGCTYLGCPKTAVTYVLLHPGDPRDPVDSGVEGVVTFNRAPRCEDHGDGRWHISHDEEANWAAHKLTAARRALADVDDLYESELARLTAWRDRQRAAHARQERFFTHHLVAYACRLRVSDPPGKERTHHDLPAATIRFTRSQSVQVDDEPALLAWARAGHDDLIDARVAVNRLRDLLKKDGQRQLLAVTADGEKVPGVRIEKRLTSKVETT